MELWRTATNPWGQEVLIGVSWTLLWVAVIVGIGFMLGHWAYLRLWAPRAASTEHASRAAASLGMPERIVRHSLAARLFHWLMTIAMFALLITAFFPVIGIRFPWVTIHWIAGVALLTLVIYHIVHALFWQNWRNVWIGRVDLREAVDGVKRFLSRSGAAPKAGKYPLDQKLYHNVVTVVTVLAVVSGLLMMVRVDTPFWARNPYLLSDRLWGMVYVAHGLAGVSLIFLVIAHVYFALRPEKWWMTLSMINGFIGREKFLQHHDPARWPVASPPQPPSSRGRAGAASGH